VETCVEEANGKISKFIFPRKFDQFDGVRPCADWHLRFALQFKLWIRIFAHGHVLF
jgi:hypothetical protein